MPAPSLAVEDEAPDEQPEAEAEAEADHEEPESMPEQETDETDAPDPEPEETDAAEDEDIEVEETESESGEDEEVEEVAEAAMPGDTDEAEETGGEGGGLLSKINTKAIIALSAVVVVAVVVLWLLRRGGRLNRTTSATDAELDAEMAHEGGGEGEYDINAPDNDPLAQDEQMMGMLGMGSGE